jgi:hypothetical protein
MRKRLIIAGLIAALGFTLFNSYELKRPCLERPWGGTQMLEYRNLCYNDVQALYGVRKLDQRKFPYVEEKSYEYPVLMGVTMWTSSLFAKNHVEYFNATAVILAFFSCLSFIALMGAIGTRKELLWFAVGSPVLFYAFLNWDMLPVAFVCLAMWAWSKKRISATGACIGLGVAAKIYPGFLLPSLAISLWRENSKKGDVRARNRQLLMLLGGAAGAWLAVNLPIVLAEYFKNGSIDGSLSVFSFHAKRGADFGTVWYWMYRFASDEYPAYLAFLPSIVAGTVAIVLLAQDKAKEYRYPLAGAFGLISLVLWLVMRSMDGGVSGDDFRSIVDHASELIFAAGAIGLWFAQWKRHHSPWVTGAAVLSLYLSVSKIHSPQHALWVFPLMIAVNVPASTLIGYLAADALVFVGGFTWFATSHDMQFNAWQVVFMVGVFARAIWLLRFSAQCATGVSDRLISHESRHLGAEQMSGDQANQAEKAA